MDPAPKEDFLAHWSAQALRIQLGAADPAGWTHDVLAGLTKEELVQHYCEALQAEGARAEADFRSLRVSGDDAETQARKYVMALTGAELDAASSLQESLRSGELLCELANVLLRASGAPPLRPSHAAVAQGDGQAAESRARAKQLENISQYTAACVSLGVSPACTFDVEDLYEGKNMPAVVKSILALAQVAHKLEAYRGPHLGAGAKDKVWQKEVSEEPALSPNLPVGKPSPALGLPAVPRTEAEVAQLVSRITDIGLDEPDWRRLCRFVDTAGCDDSEAVLRWIEEVLGESLARPLHDALKSGAALCRLLRAIDPGLVAENLCRESSKPFEQMACIDGYLKGCAKLGVKLKFMTVDLHDARELSVVPRQIFSLADAARRVPTFGGPHLGSAKDMATAKETYAACEEASRKREELVAKRAKKMERERKRIEKDMLNEEVEAERQLLQFLREEQQRRREERARTVAEAKELRMKEKQQQDEALVQKNTLRGMMYKRGGAAKAWRKRWFVLEDGCLSYYSAARDVERGLPPLGKLALANCSVRRPTDLKSKGKYQSTCLRIDIDLQAQTKVQPSTSFCGEGGDDDRKNAKDKSKYLLAAESAQGMRDWISAIDFWSARKGTKERRSVIALMVTAEEQKAFMEEAHEAVIPEDPALQGIGNSLNALEEEDDEDEDEDQVNPNTELEIPERVEEDPLSSMEPEHRELYDWTDYALRFQLQTYKWPTPDGATGHVLADCYWESLCARELQYDEYKRRWLACIDLDLEEQAKVWISSLIPVPLPEEGSFQEQLRSGEVLCDLINAIRPGIVPKVARKELLEAMSENRRNARCRENIGQYVDACAELGVPQRELFITGDLFENKDFKVVVKNIHGLARLTHYDIPDFKGPRIGIRKKNQDSSKESSSGVGGMFAKLGLGGIGTGSPALYKSSSSPMKKDSEPQTADSKASTREKPAPNEDKFRTTSL
mmetsp:Transcript_9269/g.23072  ORF Transcript_9269/g.23072 Transcript_9269/m.23072 type:complete len:960 (+) Transcript_9269:32-2911(+)